MDPFAFLHVGRPEVAARLEGLVEGVISTICDEDGIKPKTLYGYRKLLPILDLLHDLANGATSRQVTKRELYYTNVHTFFNQMQCDAILQHLCSELSLHPHMLGVVGHPRGLVRGHVQIEERCLIGTEVNTIYFHWFKHDN